MTYTDTSLRCQIHEGTIVLEDETVDCYLVLFRPEGSTHRSLAINYRGGMTLAMPIDDLRRRFKPKREHNPSSMEPSFFGSPRCQSGSIASGGWHQSCTCDTCF